MPNSTSHFDNSIQTSEKEITKWASEDGHFRRQVSSFREQISNESQFKPEKGRYHIYVSLACPWAHRVLILLQLKGLNEFIGVSVVHPFMGTEGWSWNAPDEFNPSMKGVIRDSVNSCEKLREIYFKANPRYDGRFTVPVLWDTKMKTIVNNESSEIIRMLNCCFDELIEEKYQKIDLYPQHLRKEIDSMNEWIYDQVNNGVYKSGFATTQSAYESAVQPLFEALDRLEEGLRGGKDYLVGGQLTEVDVRLFTTLIRFDVVYVTYFKCNLKTIRGGYPNLNHWLKCLYWKNPAFKDTTNFAHIKLHYFTSHPQINPTKIIPIGPLPEIETLDD
ncbi:glutathione S-transferase [Melampsora americana]|nr:glutathione S-transferase [Melampsora americana]